MKKFVTYPRSGNHFLQKVIAQYSGRAHSSIYAPDHDRNGKIGYAGCFYVWRNPVDVLYSLFVAERCYGADINVGSVPNEWLEKEIESIGNHFQFYWKHAGLVVKFNDLVGNKEWYRILKFLDLPYDKERINRISKEYSKEKIAEEYKENQWMNKRLLSDEYSQKREQFRKMYGDKILNALAKKLNKDINFLKQE